MQPYLFTSADQLLQRISANPSLPVDLSDPQTQALVDVLLRRGFIHSTAASATFVDPKKPETWKNADFGPDTYALSSDGYIRLDELHRLAEYDAQYKAHEEEKESLRRKEADEKSREDRRQSNIHLVVQSLVSIVSVFLAYYLGTL